VACAVVVANWRDGELAFVQRPTAIVMAISRTGSASMAASARSERDVAARRRQILPRPVRTPYGGGVEKWRLREVLWDDGLAVFCAVGWRRREVSSGSGALRAFRF
jgi:hypothetical protein